MSTPRAPLSFGMWVGLLLLLSLCLSAWPTRSNGQVLASPFGCTLTFAQFEASKPVWVRDAQSQIFMPAATLLNLAATCPANCTTAALTNTSTPSTLLFGSFPYSPTSSICLAAIHAGIIADATGGGLFVSRFYRHDLSNTTNQTIYPFDSWRGSLSNGVQSGDMTATAIACQPAAAIIPGLCEGLVSSWCSVVKHPFLLEPATCTSCSGMTPAG